MNNVRTQSRFGTTFKVTFPELPTFKTAPQWVRLTQEQNNHDVVEIAYASFDPYYQKVFKTGVLCKLTWKTEHAKGEWVGYVYDRETTTQATVKRNVIVRNVGAGLPFKEGGNKIWKNKTAPEIVQDLCKQHKIKAVVDKSNVRFGMQSLVGLTKWEKIQELAERIGFHAHIHNTTVYFQKIDKMIDQFSSIIPVMSYNDGSVNAGLVYDAQTLDQFKVKLGDLNESSSHEKKTKTVHGIDPVTSKSHSHTAKPTSVGKQVREGVGVELFKQVLPHIISETKGIAKELTEGMAQLARFVLHAEGQGQGDPRIAPYRTIEINGTGSTTDGFWIVKRVEHYMTYDGRYTVDFTCMMDGTGKNKGGAFRKTKASVVPTRDVGYEMATGGKQAPSTPTISTRKLLLSETDGGFANTFTRWVGK